VNRVHRSLARNAARAATAAWLGLSWGALAPATALADASPAARLFYVRAGGGIATQSLESVNRDVRATGELIQSFDPAASWREFTHGYPIELEFGYHVAPSWAVGLAGTFRQTRVENGFYNQTFIVAESQRLRLFELAATTTWWLPRPLGLHLCADVGLGFGTMAEEFTYREYESPRNDFDFVGDYGGAGFVAGVALGYEQVVPSGFWWWVRSGYRLASLGDFSGSASSPQLGTATGPPIGSDGQPLEFDFGGVSVRAGLGLSFGSR
jgi:hypothetical protein